MVSMQEIGRSPEQKYKLVPPDGGWGHLVTVSVIVMNLVSIVPLCVFGILYGSFLASIGDETTGTALANGIFNTVQSFTGLAASYLLQKYSYRKVGLLGAAVYCAGAFATIFISTLPQMIISFGVLQGLGFGLMMPASFSAFNCYFEKKINVMMGIAQAVMVLAMMLLPPVTAFLVDRIGFRGGVALLAGLSLLNFPAMGILHPVKWHMKKIMVDTSPIDNEIEKGNEKVEISNDELTRTQTVPLINKQLEGEILTKADCTKDSLSAKFKDMVLEQRRLSVMTLADRAVSITTMDNLDSGKKPSKGLDLSLFKDLKYLNISCGIALCFTSDMAFNSIIPLVLHNINYEKSTIAIIMMIFFGSDLVSRVLISIACVLFKIRNRYVFLAGAFLTALFRIAFTMYDTYTWKLTTLIALGFLRCWIQTPLVLVIAEEYKDNFPTAFSLYMVVCGFVSLIFGPLMSYVKAVTNRDDMVIHVLTLAMLLCSFTWIVELLWSNIKGRCSKSNEEKPCVAK